jgi:hypothetical protein
MRRGLNVTALVEYGMSDGEFLPILQCVCGKKYTPWDESISTYEDVPVIMKCCGRKLYWVMNAKVYEVIDA